MNKALIRALIIAFVACFALSLTMAGCAQKETRAQPMTSSNSYESSPAQSSASSQSSTQEDDPNVELINKLVAESHNIPSLKPLTAKMDEGDYVVMYMVDEDFLKPEARNIETETALFVGCVASMEHDNFELFSQISEIICSYPSDEGINAGKIVISEWLNGITSATLKNSVTGETATKTLAEVIAG